MKFNVDVFINDFEDMKIKVEVAISFALMNIINLFLIYYYGAIARLIHPVLNESSLRPRSDTRILNRLSTHALTSRVEI